MKQKDAIIRLLESNGAMTQRSIAASIYGDVLHCQNVHSTLMSLVKGGTVTRSETHPIKYSLSKTTVTE